MTIKLVTVGKGAILSQNEDFLTGYQVGQLTYRSTRHPAPDTDEKLTELFLERLESMENSTIYGMGFIVGWLNSLFTTGLHDHPVADSPVAIEDNTIEGRTECNEERNA